MWFAGNVASGSAAGATTSLFLYHLDYARTRLGTDAIGYGRNQNHRQRQFKGLRDVYRKTLSSDGVAGLYRGFGVSIIGITLYRGLYFGIYDTINPVVLVGRLEVSRFVLLFMKCLIIHSCYHSPSFDLCERFPTCPFMKLFLCILVECLMPARLQL